MIQVRYEKCKDDKNKDKFQCEIQFLKVLTMNNDQKQIHLPSSLLSTERGGRAFPKRELLPFLQKIATNVKHEINEANFKRYRENLFKIAEMKLKHDNTIYETFMSCWKPLSSTRMDPIPEGIIKTCISELVCKLINVFKKNWDVTRRQHMQHDKGQASSVTLNLRDTLKAYVAH